MRRLAIILTALMALAAVAQNNVKTVYFDNRSTQWATPYIFTWLVNGNSDNGWPGATMTLAAGNIYRYTVTGGHNKMVFHDGTGDATKTADFDIVDGHVYTTAGDQGSIDSYNVGSFTPPTLYVSGVFNNWPTPGNDNSYALTGNGRTVSVTIDFNGEGRFGIYGNNWSPKYCLASNTTPAITGEISGIQLMAAAGDENESYDIHYNLTGRYTVTFDVITYKLSVSTPVVEKPTTINPPYYISGDINSWTAPGSDDNYKFTPDGDNYSLTLNFNGGGRFCIYGQSWDHRFCNVDASVPYITGEVSNRQLRIATDTDNYETEIYYNLQGEYKLIFNPQLMTLSVKDNTITVANGTWGRVYTTTPDLSKSLKIEPVESSTTGTANITIDPSSHLQQIDGFGYAITYSAAYNLLHMSDKQRGEILKRTFSPTDGYGVSYIRISIGTSDFASREYTLCDSQGPNNDLLRDFALQSDELNYVIPIIKQIMGYNPNIKVIATPWTPPRWMKTATTWTNGELNSAYYDTYGDYFVKFIQAMNNYGIDIYAVTPQNEPMNRDNSASCYMSWQAQADFIKQSLAPKIKNAGLGTRIYLWDHNYNYDNISDQEDYPYKALQRMGTNFTGYDLVSGTAWHKYTGYENDWQEMIDIYNKTGKDNLFTEASIGDWNDAGDLSKSLARDMRDLVIHPSMGYARGSLAWNFVLDTDRGPYRPGGCQICHGAIDVNPVGNYFTFTSHYFIMAHASAVVKPGAYRVPTTGSVASDVTCTAYINPDGTLAVLLANTSTSNRTANINAAGRYYSIPVPAQGVVSACLGMSGGAAGANVITPPAPSDHATIYLDNSNTSWATPTVFTWGDTGDNGWPGKQMTIHDTDVYKYEVPTGHNMLLFNAGDGDATKTEDLAIYPNHLYTINSDKTVTHTLMINATDLYLSGVFNNWVTPGAEGSAQMRSIHQGLYSFTTYFNGEGRFNIYGPGWDPKYCVTTSTPTITGAVENVQLHKATEATQSTDSDINYNLTGPYSVVFNPKALTLSLSDASTTSLSSDTINLPEPVYFDLMGRRVDHPSPGIYIRIDTTGHRSKILIK